VSPAAIWDDLRFIGGEAFIHQCDRLLLPQSRVVKRAMDLIIGSLISVVALPAIAIIALLIKLTSRGPAFYRSERIGAANREFAMTKFRTMRVDADDYLEEYLRLHPERREEWDTQQKLKDDPRITVIGRFLRRTSLDELPQLIDVLMGNMSLVGPRPILMDEPLKYGPHFHAFCRMLPGMTGLWQVSGRNRIPYEQRVALVTYYVQNWSPWFDLYLLAKTAKVVITGDGAF
jgi:Undecaprenyl-phosphate galactose phosphotransferase WbaP